MKIGIVPALDPSSGGMYQYSEMMLEALRAPLADVEQELLARDPQASRALELHRDGWSVRPLFPPSLRDRVRSFSRRVLPEVARERLKGRLVNRLPPAGEPPVRRDLQEWLRRSGFQLLLFPAPDPLAFEAGLPSIMAIHDLQHRLQPEFPEVSADGEAARREYLFRNAAERALMLLVDSETGKEDVLRLYGDVLTDPARVKILPFVPPPSVITDVSEQKARQVMSRYSLPSSFLFYPAQFWPHKNHVRLIEAVGKLSQRGLDTPIVLTGSSGGTLRSKTLAEVKRRARELRVDHLVRCLGYVSDEDLSVLYARATALVMPTFFGPTNIPVVEAWNFGLPVVTSDIRGITEQVQDAALLVDPRSAESIADAIEVIWNNLSLREQLRSAGRRRLDSYTRDDYRDRLRSILTEARLLIDS